MSTDETLLADVPLFSLLDAEERRALAARLEVARINKGDTIFHLGDPGDCLYVVRSGKVEIFAKETTGEKIVFLIAEQGELFGELAIFDSGPRSANALALEDTEVLI